MTDASIAALAAEGLVPTSYRSAIDVLEAVPPVLVLDTASDVEPACTWLDWLNTLPVKPHVIVCISDRATDTLRRLFLSGADDVMMYPLLMDALAERIRSVHRQLSQ
jgi:DNA-binding response OmpR family regulator